MVAFLALFSGGGWIGEKRKHTPSCVFCFATRPVVLDPAAKEALHRSGAEVLCLQRQLDMKENQAYSARESEKKWRAELLSTQEHLATQQESTLDITSDMSRQFKAMQVGEDSIYIQGG